MGLTKEVSFQKYPHRSQAVILLLVWMLLVGAAAAAEPVSLDEYQARIKDCLNLVQAKEGELQAEESAFLQERLDKNLRVTTRQGKAVRVDTAVLDRWIQEAQSASKGRTELQEHLRALLEQVSMDMPELPYAGSDWERSRLRLDEIYRAKEFRHLQEEKASAWKAFVERLIQSLMKWLQDHAGFMEGVSLKGITYVIYGLLILSGCLLMIWIWRSSGPMGWGFRQPSAGRAPEFVPAVDVDWPSLRAEADRRAMEGAFRDAIRAFFVSVLKEGHARGWWVYQRETTNQEHLARVKGPEARRDALQELIDIYEDAWYGLGEPREDAFLSCKEWFRRMEAAA